MSELQIQVDERRDATVVAVRGDAGAANVSKLERELQRLAGTRATLWVFDLSGLTFISSVGVVALVAFQRNVGRGGTKVRLAAVPADVLNVLQAARLANAFNLSPSVDDAMRGD
jgi:anti-anti-sigma factor